MRSASDNKKSFLDQLAHAVRRPGMYVCCVSDLNSLLLGLIQTLLFIDECDEISKSLLRQLEIKGYFNACGVSGRFSEASYPGLPKDFDLTFDISSVYAEVAHQLGYFKLDRSLKTADWDRLVEWAKGDNLNQDLRRSQVLTLFGEPSLSLGFRPAVDCYSGGNIENPWVCFTYYNILDAPPIGESPTRKTWRFGEDPILRSVRQGRGIYVESFRLTPYGHALVDQSNS